MRNKRSRVFTCQEVDLETALALLAAKRARQAEREAKGLPPRGRRLAKPAAGAKKATATRKVAGKASGAGLEVGACGLGHAAACGWK